MLWRSSLEPVHLQTLLVERLVRLLSPVILTSDFISLMANQSATSSSCIISIFVLLVPAHHLRFITAVNVSGASLAVCEREGGEGGLCMLLIVIQISTSQIKLQMLILKLRQYC